MTLDACETKYVHFTLMDHKTIGFLGASVEMVLEVNP